MKVIVCIPARYGSTRFAGKVLASDTGKYLIQHTHEQASKAKLPSQIIIAADDEKVANAAKSFGAECVMTSADCASGTDRIAEAIQNSKFEIQNSDIVVNLQGDEPEIDPDNIDLVAQLLIDNPDVGMATLAAKFETKEQIANPNIVKVITRAENRGPRTAIYFSRSVIPYNRDCEGVGDVSQYLRHLGIYAYRKDFLMKFTQLPSSRLEQTEKLEQLRAVENGYLILVAITEHTCDGIDTQQQYEAFVERYKKLKPRINNIATESTGIKG